MALLIFLLIIVLLILVHEWGHFCAAKLFGIRVDEFGIGFPPRLWSFVRGETVYSLNVVLLGGFVRMFGEHGKEDSPLPEEDKRKNFSYKPRGVQVLVVLAGILFNLLFAWLVLSVGYVGGLPTSAEHIGVGHVQDIQTTIVDVIPSSPASLAGINPGDVVLQAQTATATTFPGATSGEVQQFIVAHQNESVILTIERSGVKKVFLAKPESGLVAGHKAIGVELDDVGILKLSPPQAFLEGAVLFWHMFTSTAMGLASFFSSLVHGSANFSEVSGPIGIADIGVAAVHQGFAAVVVLTGLISINLALINVIPIPGLDGGRLVLVAIEAIHRRQLPERVVTLFTLIGFLLLIILLLVVSYHDIVRILYP